MMLHLHELVAPLPQLLHAVADLNQLQVGPRVHDDRDGQDHSEERDPEELLVALPIELAHELFRIWADEVYEIGTVGLTPMVQGVIVANLKLHNVPETAGNDWPLRTPGNTRPEQYFFEQ